MRLPQFHLLALVALPSALSLAACLVSFDGFRADDSMLAGDPSAPDAQAASDARARADGARPPTDAGAGADPGIPPAIDADSNNTTGSDGATPQGGNDSAAPPTCSPCDVVLQCGCGAGQACDNTAQAQSTCRAVQTAGTETSACTDYQDCAAGFTCRGVSPHFSCHKWCTSDSDCIGGSRYCDIATGSGNLCGERCSPLTGQGCATGFACQLAFNSAKGRWGTACRWSGTGVQDDHCSSADDCAAGYYCGPWGFCSRYCDRGVSSPCANYRSCAPLSPSSPTATLDGTTFGACR